MKHTMTFVTHQPRRPPLRTATEIAQMLGVTVQALSRAMMRDPAAPKPVMVAKQVGHVTGRNRVWYEPVAVFKWWEQRT